MFVHSLWFDVGGQRDALVQGVEAVLGPSALQDDRIRRWVVPAPEPRAGLESADSSWSQVAPETIRIEQFVLLFVQRPDAEIAAVVSPSPLLNHRVAEQLQELRTLTFVAGPEIMQLSTAEPWHLYALHLRTPDQGTEIVIQGALGDRVQLSQVLLSTPELDLYGATLALPELGGLLTVYDDGQAWISGLAPEQLPEALLSAPPLLG